MTEHPPLFIVQIQMTTKLSDCTEGDTRTILRLKGNGRLKSRLIELGFRRGQEVEIVRYAPLKDPMEVFIAGSHISLRIEEAELIEVSEAGEAAQ